MYIAALRRLTIQHAAFGTNPESMQIQHTCTAVAVLFISLFPLHAVSHAQDAQRSFSHTIQLAMVQVPGGTFSMGNTGAANGERAETPVQDVNVAPFALGIFEVTQAQFEAIMGYNPSYNRAQNKPVEQISWYDAVRFCNRLSRLDGFEPAYQIDPVTGYTRIADTDGYRLPTEAEWEYAARAGTTTDTFAGNLTVQEGQDEVLDEIAWYYTGHSEGYTRAVGGKSPSPLGLYDMLGNVWEWTDSWFANYDDKTAPRQLKTLRGGAMDAWPFANRSSYRYRLHPSYTSYNIGFRIARSLQD
ncbi:MAG: formylglycine-generating enzyme family protein [Bacteroidota bacterium]